ncbi:hypothetical protein T4D_10358 [Trichinella pseudospiralis]|uniref:Uncharacterized protein n=1 Tax=Trichinella pseudospiralis TaxID=6337 RepID=A0A0V1F2Q6_TRIPS|nr:hypothetical protein T4D_10358 [Trichinella pseudospiralis]
MFYPSTSISHYAASADFSLNFKRLLLAFSRLLSDTPDSTQQYCIRKENVTDIYDGFIYGGLLCLRQKSCMFLGSKPKLFVANESKIAGNTGKQGVQKAAALRAEGKQKQ